MKSAGDLAAISNGGNGRDDIFCSLVSGLRFGRQTRDLHLNPNT